MNTDLSVPDLLSKTKGVVLIVMLIFDIFCAILQLLPYMGTKWFLLTYVICYVVCFFLYFLVSIKDPGYKGKKPGFQILSYLKMEYGNASSNSKINLQNKNIAAKYCFTCNIPKSSPFMQ